MADKLEGIPGADPEQLKQMISQDQPDKDKQKPEESKKNDDMDLGQFKNPKDMLKSYKEIQGAFTRTSQEKKELEEKIAKLEEQMEMAKYRSPGPGYTPPENLKDFDELLSEDPRKAIESVVTNTARTMRIAEVLEEIQEQDPENFQSRYNYAQSLSQNPQYAHLANSPVGIRKLFKAGDQLREQESKKNASKALEAILGGPVDEQKIAKLREAMGLTSKQPNKQQTTQLGDVYMPDTSDTYRPGPETLSDAKKNYSEAARKAEQEGDIDGVIEAAFGKALAE